MKLHKEGKYIIPVALIGFTLVSGILAMSDPGTPVMMAVALPFAIILFLIINFFRHPDVNSPKDTNLLLSPCDGKVVVIEEVDNPEGLQGKMRQVSIFMSPLNVHVNRVPFGGKITKVEYRPGKYLVAWHPKSSSENEQTFLVIEQNGVQIGFKQIAGALARRIRWYVKPGDVLTAGDEFGFIRFGSRMDVIMPADAEMQVSLGDKVTGGETILAKL